MKNDTQPAAAETVDSGRIQIGGAARLLPAPTLPAVVADSGPHPCRRRCPPGLNRTHRAAPQFGGAAVPEPALEPANNRRIGESDAR